MSDSPPVSDGPELAARRCGACAGEEAPMKAEEFAPFRKQVPDWEVVDGHHLVRRWKTDDFKGALDLAERFGAVAEEEGHHPELRFTWGWIEARIWTHKVDGLTLADFVLAAKFDRAAR